MSNLISLGWGDFHASQVSSEELTSIGRVVEQQRELCAVRTHHGERWCGLSGRLRRHAEAAGEFPVVGDWVVLDPEPGERGRIERILDRRTRFIRRAPGSGAEQVVVANVDVAVVVAAAGADLNLRRIERYLTLIWDSGARPAILLSKCDVCSDPGRLVREIESVAPGIAVVEVSARTGQNLHEARKLIPPGKTGVFIGSSGAGKSTLVNALAGEEVQTVQEISGFKDKGRHTTTARKLFRLSDGGIVIDTPGMRELGLVNVESGLSQAFEDVDAVVVRCRFTDCKHETEPGCAVLAALDAGTLDPARWRSYLKLQRENAYHQRQEDPEMARRERERWKKIGQIGRSRARRV